ncbi:MAG TPA: 30S ribosome-binding factor RbfA [Bdellovibrionota bacterium]|nr:30S ribosome-binding factor RbfA [Bdellovibrionota bacterium]
MSIRQMRVADQIRAEIARLLIKDLKDPRIGFITITKVVVTPDLKVARVYFTKLSHSPKDKNASLAGLKSAGGFIKRMLGKNLELRYIPNIEFYHDDSFEYENRIGELIEKTKEEEE